MTQRKNTVKAIVVQKLDGTIEIEAPFNAKFVSAIKGGVHMNLRTWVPDVECTDPEHHMCTGRWVIAGQAKLDAVTIIRNFYPLVEEQTLGSGTIVHKWEGI